MHEREFHPGECESEQLTVELHTSSGTSTGRIARRARLELPDEHGKNFLSNADRTPGNWLRAPSGSNWGGGCRSCDPGTRLALLHNDNFLLINGRLRTPYRSWLAEGLPAADYPHHSTGTCLTLLLLSAIISIWKNNSPLPTSLPRQKTTMITTGQRWRITERRLYARFDCVFND